MERKVSVGQAVFTNLTVALVVAGLLFLLERWTGVISFTLPGWAWPVIFDEISKGLAFGSVTVTLSMAAAYLIFYFLPAWVALRVGHRNKAAVFTLNLLTGWTFFGWVGALVWAVKR